MLWGGEATHPRADPVRLAAAAGARRLRSQDGAGQRSGAEGLDLRGAERERESEAGKTETLLVARVNGGSSKIREIISKRVLTTLFMNRPRYTRALFY
jgi:hypothetical protein